MPQGQWRGQGATTPFRAGLDLLASFAWLGTSDSVILICRTMSKSQ